MKTTIKNIIVYIVVAIILGIFCSCQGNNQEGIPSYIQIDTAYFSVNQPSIQGSASSNISDVWVYVDNQIQGVYELPVIFPILKAGKTNIFFRAGVKNNGMLDSRTYYPFYDRYTPESVVLTPEKITKIEPHFTYIQPEYMTFAWMENFENFSSSLTKSTGSDTSILIASGNQAFEGNFSGKIVLENTHTYFEIHTAQSFANLPVDGKPIFLELDFKVDTIMTVGIEVIYSSSYVIKYPCVVLNPKDTWKKIYISLGYPIMEYYDADEYKIYFSGGNYTEETTNRKEFYIDNLKFVY